MYSCDLNCVFTLCSKILEQKRKLQPLNVNLSLRKAELVKEKVRSRTYCIIGCTVL